METNINPLLCDPESGICALPGAKEAPAAVPAASTGKPVKIVYFTDPICSTCWGIEPQLRRLKLEYGQEVEIAYHMGGLLPDWSYNSGGISKPSDVAHHWDEVSRYYQMPIDGDVWLEDPLPSSYPPSIAFKAAQLQDEQQAIVFLRVLREFVFLQKKNIAKAAIIEQAAVEAGLDAAQLKVDIEGKAQLLFMDDLILAREMRVRGFPSVFITGADGSTEFVYGFRPYDAYEQGIRKVYPKASKADYPKDWDSLFDIYPTLTTREFAELSDLSFLDAEVVLRGLVRTDVLSQVISKNGCLWRKG